MKKYTTQNGLMWQIRFTAIFFIIFTTLLAIIFRKESLLLIYIFSIMLFLMSYLAYITRIVIIDNIIEVKSPAINGRYNKEELIEIVIYGKRLNFGMSNINLKFLKNENGQIKNIRIQSNIKLLKKLLKNFNGKIKIETIDIEDIKVRLYKLGANNTMF